MGIRVGSKGGGDQRVVGEVGIRVGSRVDGWD